MLIYDFVPFSLIVVLVILKLSEGIDRVLGENILTRLI